MIPIWINNNVRNSYLFDYKRNGFYFKYYSLNSDRGEIIFIILDKCYSAENCKDMNGEKHVGWWVCKKGKCKSGHKY